MDPLLVSEEQLALSMSDLLSGTNNHGHDANGNVPCAERGTESTGDRADTLNGNTNVGVLHDVGDGLRPGFAAAETTPRREDGRVSFLDGWRSANPSRTTSETRPVMVQVGRKRLWSRSGSGSADDGEDMITLSALPKPTPDAPSCKLAVGAPSGGSGVGGGGGAGRRLGLAGFGTSPTSLVLTAPSPVTMSMDGGPTLIRSVAAPSGACRQYSTLVPHQSAAATTAPFWYPMTPSAARTLRSVEADDDGARVPDLRSVASGALVDIEIPSSYAGSSVSVTGSQTTLLSAASPHNHGSVRRSLSADSLFAGTPAASGAAVAAAASYGSGMAALGESPSSVVVFPECQRPEADSPFSPLSMTKRASSLDHLRIVSPYPMPQLSCFMNSKTAEMVRSLSLEERTSLAISLGDELICRICWQGSEAEDIIQPCYCSTHVHMSCVKRWLGVAKITHCEVCRYQYKAYRKMKPLSEWRWWPHKNRHLAQLEATLILLGVVTPPLLCGIILCSQKIADYLKTIDNAWKTAGLMTLVMVSVGTYLGAILYFCHKFATVCKVWVSSNRTTVVTVIPLSPAERRPKLNPCRVWSIS